MFPPQHIHYITFCFKLLLNQIVCSQFISTRAPSTFSADITFFHLVLQLLVATVETSLREWFLSNLPVDV